MNPTFYHLNFQKKKNLHSTIYTQYWWASQKSVLQNEKLKSLVKRETYLPIWAQICSAPAHPRMHNMLSFLEQYQFKILCLIYMSIVGFNSRDKAAYSKAAAFGYTYLTCSLVNTSIYMLYCIMATFCFPFYFMILIFYCSLYTTQCHIPSKDSNWNKSAWWMSDCLEPYRS